MSDNVLSGVSPLGSRLDYSVKNRKVERKKQLIQNIGGHLFGNNRISMSHSVLIVTTDNDTQVEDDLRNNTFANQDEFNSQEELSSSRKNGRKEKVFAMLERVKAASQEVKGISQGIVIESECGKYRYHLSIIDYLQKYTLSKRLERCAKAVFRGAPLN